MELITTLIDGYQSLPQKEKIMLLSAFFATVFIIYRLARSEEVNESGRVIVSFHSPLTWPKRFSEQIEKNRAGYSDKNKSFLSFFWTGSRILHAIPPFLISLFFFFMAYLKYGKENFWFILGAGFLCLLLFFWQLPKFRDNPFKN